MPLLLLSSLCSLPGSHTRDRPKCFTYGKNNWFIQRCFRKCFRNFEKGKLSSFIWADYRLRSLSTLGSFDNGEYFLKPIEHRYSMVCRHQFFGVTNRLSACKWDTTKLVLLHSRSIWCKSLVQIENKDAIYRTLFTLSVKIKSYQCKYIDNFSKYLLCLHLENNCL